MKAPKIYFFLLANKRSSRKNKFRTHLRYNEHQIFAPPCTACRAMCTIPALLWFYSLSLMLGALAIFSWRAIVRRRDKIAEPLFITYILNHIITRSYCARYCRNAVTYSCPSLLKIRFFLVTYPISIWFSSCESSHCPSLRNGTAR